MFASSSAPTEGVLSGAPSILGLDVDSRLAFLRKTYGLFTLGIAAASAGALAGMTVPGLGRSLFGLGWIGLMVIMLVGYFAVYALRKTPVLNVVAFLAYLFVDGLTLTPILAYTLMAKGATIGTMNILTAFGGTSVAFAGLTAYVFISRKDFSYLGGFLVMGFLGMLGFAIFGMVAGMGPGAWMLYHGLGLLLGCGYILFVTSRIMNNYSQDEYVLAALCLATEFIAFFIHLLSLLNSRDSR